MFDGPIAGPAESPAPSATALAFITVGYPT
jgi:hypothetical protein